MTNLSPDQVEAVNRILAWFAAAPEAEFCDDVGCCPYAHRHDPDTCGRSHTHGHAQDHPVMSLGGLAGSGKTWLTGQLDALLGIVPAYGTPTNKAAAVLRGKLPGPGRDRVRTYHSLLYQAKSTVRCVHSRNLVTELEPGEDGLRRFSPCLTPPPEGHACRLTEELRFEPRRHVEGHRDLLVLDEASMVTDERVEEMRRFGLPILLVGDHGQLPPVKASGLNRWMRDPRIVLTENHRQGETSGIVTAALRVRETGRLELGSYGDGSTVCVSARRNEAVLDVMNPTRFPPGPDRVVITHTNAMRATVNRQFHGPDPLPHVGDRVVALQQLTCPVVSSDGTRPDATQQAAGTAVEEAVYNGCVGTIRHVHATSSGVRTTRLVVELDSNHQGEPGTCVETRAATAQFGQEKLLELNQRPHGAHLWDYAYALTAHKAQGSEFDDVVVLDTGPPEYRRWLYTAMTRAKKRLIVINWRA